MPWDGTELWVAHVNKSGDLTAPLRVAGGESIYQPGWSPDGELYFTSDRTGWWQIYRAQPQAPQGASSWTIQPVLADPPARTEFGRPQWVFGTSTWACAGRSRLVVSYTRDGRWHLGTVDVRAGTLDELTPDIQPGEWLAAGDTRAVLVAGFASRPDAIVQVDIITHETEIVRQAFTLPIDASCVSVAEAVEFPTSHDRTAHAFFYPPCNPSFTAPPNESVPLILLSHGGPTTATRCTFNPAIQYWTSRGFAVADVNYGGSSGYGRAYRERLRGLWGVVDVDDMVSAAAHLVKERSGDPRRLIVRGGSAGGYTTLAALAFRPGVFSAGASYYGVCDLELLARDTHKFELRYLDSLVGPYPECVPVYRARSPIHAADRLESALILFQGLEDVVVPPSQSQLMADAVRRKGLPVAYIAFEREQHGFRRRDTIVRCLEAELYFYGRIFGFVPSDALPLIRIDNAGGS
jgi:dipeptidyl aminopeptidase/acylaminoacyl peptidase